jgi:2-keto-4-pentenoate hydratase/2-oxohepta-3-ene-1,7-dioic acid hydratase in catechol pathway
MRNYSMRFATIGNNGRVTSCVLRNRELVDLGKKFNLQDLLTMGHEAIDEICARAPAAHRYQGEKAQYLMPSFDNTKILGIGLNFTSFERDARKLGMPIPAEPFWFSRGHNCLAGPFDEVWLPDGCDDLDYEGELVCVIGKRCHRVSRADAKGVIGGYTIGNDLTMRRRAMKNPILGKFFDTHAPVGPVIVTADEIADPHTLEIRTFVNGELRQQASTSEMILDCYGIVEALSSAMILLPGDLIFTGTPTGCGINMQPPAMLKRGDRIRVEIDGIGAIENEIVAMPG